MARALYYDADIVILDDSLSAGEAGFKFMYQSLLTKFFKVDAHVGKSLFHDAILGTLRNQGKTVLY